MPTPSFWCKFFLLVILKILYVSPILAAQDSKWNIVDGARILELKSISPNWKTRENAIFTSLDGSQRFELASRLLITIESSYSLTENPLGISSTAQPLLQYVVDSGTSKTYRKIWLVYYKNLNDTYAAQQKWNAVSGEKGITVTAQPDLLPLRERKQKHVKLFDKLTVKSATFQANKELALSHWHERTKGELANIAVIDDGVFTRHPMLKNTTITDSWDIDIGVEGAVPSRVRSHGSKVAALLWAPVKDVPESLPYAVVGLTPKAKMQALKLLQPWTSKLLQAFSRAEHFGANVINVSWILTYLTPPFKDYLQYLTTEANEGKGVAIVAAAHPAYGRKTAFSEVAHIIIVTALDYDGRLANTSWNNRTDIAALGYLYTRNTESQNTYSLFAKNSASVALVVGYVAMIRSLRPELRLSEIREKLIKSSKNICWSSKIGELCYKAIDSKSLFYQLAKLD